jgi:MFS superfamily sulfate permease-like transporter
MGLPCPNLFAGEHAFHSLEEWVSVQDMEKSSEMIIHLANGAPIFSLFKAPTVVSFNDNQYLVEIDKSAIFSNYLGIKRKLEEIPAGFQVTIDLKKTKLVDHSVMENLHRFQQDYEENGGTVKILGLEKLQPMSAHALAARKANS